MVQQEYYPEWKELVAKTCDLDYGSFISHEDIQRIIHQSKEWKRYSWAIQQWRKHMLQSYNKCLENDKGRGYRIVHPREHGAVSVRFIDQAHKRAKKAVEVLTHTNVSKLSMAEKNKHDTIMSHAAGVAILTKSKSKEAKELLGKEFKPLL